MQAIDDYLKNPTDPATLRALRGLKPKERKAALQALDAAFSARQEEVQGIPSEQQIEKQPEDTPGRAEGLAAWQRRRECWRARVRAGAVIAMSESRLPRRGRDWWSSTLLEPQVLELLLEDPPKWLPPDYAGLEKCFPDEHSVKINDLADVLIRAGLLPSPPADSAYHRRWETYLAEACDHSAEKALEWIRRRDGFLDHEALEWIRSRMTKDGVDGPDWYENHHGYCNFSRENRLPVRFWDLLIELASPAQRLAMQLALLDALAECSKDYFAHGGIRLWKAVGFPDEDGPERQGSLAAVLRSPSPAATRFAIQQLESCVGEPWFDQGLLVEHLPTALLHEAKPLRREVVALARCAVETGRFSGELVATMTDAAVDGDPKVRGEFVAMVEALAAEDRAALGEALAPVAAGIPMATRKSLESLVEGLAEVAELPEPVPPIEPVVPTFPRVVPAADVDEVVQLGAALLDTTPEPLDLERFLDGLIRFAAREPGRLKDGLDSLVKRARRIHEGRSNQGAEFCKVAIYASEMILTFSSDGRPNPGWIRRPSDPPSFALKNPGISSHYPERGPFVFVAAMLGELLDVAAAGRENGMLSLPEFTDGSIGPGTLAARCDSMSADGEPPTPYERSLAQLRCASEVAGLSGGLNHEMPGGETVYCSGYGKWSSDVRWRYCLTPHDLEEAIRQDCEHLCNLRYLGGKTLDEIEAAVVRELASRRPPVGKALCDLMIRLMASSTPRQGELGIELMHQAVLDGRFQAAESVFGEETRRALDYDPFEYFVSEITWLARSLRELSNRSPQARNAVRSLLASALEQPPKEIPKGLPGLLELALELFAEEPPADVASFSDRWPDLTRKAKTLARKISSLGGK